MNKIILVILSLFINFSSFAICKEQAMTEAIEYAASKLSVPENSLKAEIIEGSVDETYGHGEYYIEIQDASNGTTKLMIYTDLRIYEDYSCEEGFPCDAIYYCDISDISEVPLE